MTDTRQLIEAIVAGIQEKKGHDTAIIDLSKIITAPAQTFVLCTGRSPQQVEALADSIEEFARTKAGEKAAAMVGKENAEWIALDYGTVMVHVFLPEARDYYDLEHLWEDAPTEHIADLD